jgi:hypothetical protein
VQPIELIPTPPPDYRIDLAPHNVLIATHKTQAVLYLDEQIMRWKPLITHVKEVAHARKKD